MRVSLPFTYHVDFIRKGKRNSEQALRITTSDFDLEEVPGEQARYLGAVGHDFSPVEESYLGNRFPLIKGAPAKLWQVGETLYAQVCDASDFPHYFDEVSSNLDPLRTHGTSRTLLESGSHSELPDDFTYDQAVVEHGQLRQWNDDLGINRRAAISERLAEGRIIDGGLCFPVTEPVYLVTTRDEKIVILVQEVVAGGASLFSLPRELAPGLGGGRFRLDDHDQALEHARLLSSLTGYPVKDYTRKEHGTALESRYASEADNLRRVALQSKLEFESFAVELPAPVALAWTDLRDAFDGASDKTLTPRIAESFAAFVGALESHGATEWDIEHPTIGRRSKVDPRRHVVSKDLADSIPVIGRAFVNAWETRAPSHREWVDRLWDQRPMRREDVTTRDISTLFQLDRLAFRLDVPRSSLESKIGENDTMLVEVKHGAGRSLAVFHQSGELWNVVEIIGLRGRDEGGRVAEIVDDLATRINMSAEDEMAMDIVL